MKQYEPGAKISQLETATDNIDRRKAGLVCEISESSRHLSDPGGTFCGKQEEYNHDIPRFSGVKIRKMRFINEIVISRR